MYVEAAGQPQQQEVALPLERSSGQVLGRILWLEAAILLAIVQVLFAGYRMGVGNQTIQIPFLKQSANPQLYAESEVTAHHSRFLDFLTRFLAAEPDTRAASIIAIILIASSPFRRFRLRGTADRSAPLRAPPALESLATGSCRRSMHARRRAGAGRSSYTRGTGPR